MSFDDLTNAKTVYQMIKNSESSMQSRAALLRDQNGTEPLNESQARRQYLMYEISKDQLLYKALYVIVSYFCIGTELRFLAPVNKEKYSLKDSEIWHAKAIHIASYFLPNDCPLILHIS